MFSCVVVLVVGSVYENEQNFGPTAQHTAVEDARLGALVGVYQFFLVSLFWSLYSVSIPVIALRWSIRLETYLSEVDELVADPFICGRA